MKTISQLKWIVLLAMYGMVSFNLYGQDPQFSQLYANPLFLNPARTGYEQAINKENAGFKARFATRIQWPQLSSSFVSTTGSVDGYDESTRFGVGMAFIHDQQGDFITQNGLKGLIAYHLQLSETGSFIHTGFDVSHHWMNYSTSGLTFMDQLNGGGKPTTSIDPLAQILYQKNYWNLGGGIIVELRPEDEKLFFIGVSAHNLLKPNLAFNPTLSSSNQVDTTIPTLWGLELGYQKAFDVSNSKSGKNWNRTSSLSANAYLKMQGQSMQLDIGVTYNFDEPIMLGLYYRGIPLRKYNDQIQQDALVGMFGVDFGDLGADIRNVTFRYSYDIGISSLSRSGGSHEFVLSATFGSANLNIFGNRNARKQIKCVKWQN